MKSPTTYARPASKIATTAATTSSSVVYDDVLPPLILTNTFAMHNNSRKKTSKSKNFNSNNKVIVADEGEEFSSPIDETSLSASTRSLSSATTTYSTSSSSTSSSRSLSSFSSSGRSRRRLSKELFNPDRLPQKSSMKDSSLSQSQSRQRGQNRQQQSKRSKSGIIKLYLPGRRDPIIRQRSIQFHEEVSVREVRPAKSIVKNKKNDDTDPTSILWFQQDEYDKIRGKTYKLIDHISANKENGKQYCTRGLEKLMFPRECIVKRQQAQDAVLVEQYLQHGHGIYDEQRIADAYKQLTNDSRFQALQRGKKDSIVAESILRTKFEQCSNHNQRTFYHRKESTSLLRGKSYHEKRSNRTKGNKFEGQQQKSRLRRSPSL